MNRALFSIGIFFVSFGFAQAERRSCSELYAKAEPASRNIQRFRKVSDAFAESELVEFYNNNGLLRRHRPEAGRSYTALILDGKLILGKNITGWEKGKPGGAGSHFTLLDLYDQERETYRKSGGAIRFNADGSMDVSGYHMKSKSAVAADKLAQMIRKIFPRAKLRVTPDRLSTLSEN